MIKSNPFKWGHYQSEIILLCVRWYLRYAFPRVINVDQTSAASRAR